VPELPEVQTVVDVLAGTLPGHKIRSVHVSWNRTVAAPAMDIFIKRLTGATVESVARRGKYIVIGLRDRGCLLAHLRMSGNMVVVPESAARSKHERTRFVLSGRLELRFEDPRKFGRLYLVDNAALILGALGVEPLEREFTAELLYSILKTHMRRIKPLLLDQRLIAGLGNIYVTEALWHSGIHPLTHCNRISMARAVKLHGAIREVLAVAIQNRGTDIGDGVWKPGGYTPQAYGSAGKPCSRCGVNLKHLVIAQRSSVYCPTCQRR